MRLRSFQFWESWGGVKIIYLREISLSFVSSVVELFVTSQKAKIEERGEERERGKGEHYLALLSWIMNIHTSYACLFPLS